MTEANQVLLTRREGAVLVLSNNNVAARNALSPEFYAAVSAALKSAATDPTVGAVVLTGEGGHFCAGGDLRQLAKRRELPVQERRAKLEGLHDLIRSVRDFPKPVIAAVCGPAVGIGTTMLFHCDLVYAGDNAAFAMPFVNLGLCPEAASSLLVPQMMGYHRAAEALLLGEPFMAEAALEVGLVNKVLPPSEATNYAQAVARKLAAKPMSALLQTKQLMKKGQTALVLAQMNEEATHFGRMLREPAAREAFGAFMEKRKPDFSKL